jgi:GNAT superfamily N-acetyltransferase
MRIRTAKIQDAEVIAHQNILLAKESESITLQPETVLAGVQALISDKKKGVYIVAEENGLIIGQLMITVEWSDWRNKPLWWIQSVYVSKNYRKRGVFTALLRYTEQEARTQNVAFLRLYAHKTNMSALAVYEKMGWKQEPYLVYHRPM